MKNKMHISIRFLTLVFFCSSSIADELNFETSTSSIIEKLSAPPVKPIKLRSSLSTIGPKTKLPEIEIRGLTRVKLDTLEGEINTDNIIEEHVEIPVKQTQAHVNLKIEFDSNSSMIKSSSFVVLAELSKALQSPALINKLFFINGHTDSDGNPNYNLKLSLQRAVSVKKFLMALGSTIRSERLTVVGYGESLPLVKNDSAYNKQINRRVEIVAK